MASYGMPQMDFGTIGSLADVYRGAQQNARKQQALQQFAQTQDPNVLAASGDPTLANMAMTYMQRKAAEERDARDFAFRQEESKRAQSNADRSYGLQSSQIAFQREQAREKPSIQKVKDAAGNENLLLVTPDGRSRPISTADAAAMGGAGAAVGPNNPFAPDGKQTEGQANAGLYAGRMFQAEKILRDPAVEKAAQSALERGAAALPGAGKVFNMNSNDYQKFDQAQRNFINAVLRRESGAVISDQEFDNARQQYFPAPGDTPDRLAQKRANRAEAIRGIAGAAGPAWRAPATFDGKGNMQEREAPAKPGGNAAPRRTTGPTSETREIPQAAIQALRADPNRKAEFEAKYGAGTAGAVLR